MISTFSIRNEFSKSLIFEKETNSVSFYTTQNCFRDLMQAQAVIIVHVRLLSDQSTFHIYYINFFICDTILELQTTFFSHRIRFLMVVIILKYNSAKESVSVDEKIGIIKILEVNK